MVAAAAPWVNSAKLPRGSYLDPLVLPDGAVAACGAGAVREWKVNLGVLGPAQPPHLA